MYKMNMLWDSVVLSVMKNIMYFVDPVSWLSYHFSANVHAILALSQAYQ